MDNEEVQVSKENTENKRVGRIQMETKKGINKALIITAIVLSIIAITMVVFALVNKLNTNVYSNVYINNINVGGQTEQQLVETVKTISEDFKKKVVTIKYGDNVIMELTPDSIDMSLDEQTTINNTMQYGRTENIVLNNIR